MSVRTLLLTALLIGATASLVRLHVSGSASPPAALAQDAQAPSPPTTAPPLENPPTRNPPPPTRPVSVDESALRYFASQGDTRRLEAEIARLKALYPDWTPPDPNALTAPAGGDPELDRIWRLIGEGRLSEARSAIAARSAADNLWQPPQSMLDQLASAEAARRLVNASDGQQWATVLAIATETPALLTCGNVDALWRVAEAFAKTDKADRARDAYRYILVNCSDPAERLATVQKASTLLPDSHVRDLLSLERTGPDGKGEFAAIRADLARNRVGKASQDPTSAVEADELAEVERLAREGSSADDALILGYYLLSHGEPAKSLEWFRRAADRDAGARAAEGNALALIELDRFGEAEAAAEPFRAATPANRKVYLTAVTALLSQTPPPRLDPPVLARMTLAVSEARDAIGAQALGWYAYNIGQTRTAAQWFSKGLSWDSNLEPAAFGLALSRQRLRDRAGLQALASEWAGRSERIADLSTESRTSDSSRRERRSPDRASPAEDGSDSAPRRVSAGASGRAAAGGSALSPGTCGAGGAIGREQSLSAGAALARGWCLMDRQRPAEAVHAFVQARSRGNGQTASDAAYGLTLAYLALGLTAEAEVAASGLALPEGRREELTASIVTQRALAAYRNGRYKETLISLDERARLRPEQNDLLMLRAWSYFNLGRYDDAAQIFTAISKTGSAEADQALQGLNVIRQKLGQVRE